LTQRWFRSQLNCLDVPRPSAPVSRSLNTDRHTHLYTTHYARDAGQLGIDPTTGDRTAWSVPLSLSLSHWREPAASAAATRRASSRTTFTPSKTRYVRDTDGRSGGHRGECVGESCQTAASRELP